MSRTAGPPAVPPPFCTTDYRTAGIALSVPGATLSSVTPDAYSPVFTIAGLPEDFTAQLAADAYQVSALAVARNQEKCLRLRLACLRQPRWGSFMLRSPGCWAREHPGRATSTARL